MKKFSIIFSGFFALCAACQSESTGVDDRNARPTIALVAGSDFAADPDRGGTTIRWLAGGRDTVLSAVWDSLPLAAALVNARDLGFVYVLALSRQQLIVAQYDLRLRSVRRVVSPLFVDLPDPRNTGSLASASLAIGLFEPVVMPSAGVILSRARGPSGLADGLIAISMQTLKPVWYLPGRDVQASARASDSSYWLSVRTRSGPVGENGVLLRLHVLTGDVLDSVSFPARSAQEAYPWSLRSSPTGSFNLLALTTGAFFVCRGSPISCQASVTPVTGQLSSAGDGSEWIQGVASPRFSLFRSHVRVIGSEAQVIRDLIVPSLDSAVRNGVVSANSVDGGRTAILISPGESAGNLGPAGAARICIVEVQTGALLWEWVAPAGSNAKIAAAM